MCNQYLGHRGLQVVRYPENRSLESGKLQKHCIFPIYKYF